ncbi:MAG TPA: efflux RND transporter permease subunit [Planctomycetota bacterium]
MSGSRAAARSGSGPLGVGVRRPVGMLMIILAIVVFGVMSLGKLPFDLLPPVDYPSLTVRTVYPGAAPEDLEERVTERLEDALSTVGGLVRMSSSSRAEVSEILLEFEWGRELALLVQDVRERLDRVFLPQGVERPLILRYDPSLDPVLRIALSGTDDLVRLRDVSEQEIERSLESLQGVAAVKVRGGLEDEVQVRVDPQKLAAYRLTPEFVRQRLAEENLNVPGGSLIEGSVEYVVRTLNEFHTLEEIEALPLVVRNDTPILLRDLATVVRSNKDRDVVLRVGGQEAVEIDVFREAGANIVAVAKVVRNRLFGTTEQRAYWDGEGDDENDDEADSGGAGEGGAALQRELMGNFIARKLPGDLHLTLLSDQSEFVRGAINEVRDAGVFGGLLAVLVCFLFLGRLSVTLIVGVAIPVSIVATFGAMYVAGVSLNVMSLGGLALGIGMLVDNTIVVLESIARCRDEGDSPRDAALRGVREVGGAVTASTLTTVAVFAPIVFVEGVAGQIFGDQAMTVVASLAISLAVALFFIPGLAARMDLGSQRKRAGVRGLFGRLAAEFKALGTAWRGGGGGDGSAPRRGMRWRRRLLWLLPAGGAFAGSVMLAGMRASKLAPYKGKGPDRPEMPDGLEQQAAILLFGAVVLALPLVLVAGEPLLQGLGRLLRGFLGTLIFVMRWLGGMLLAPLLLVLAIPAGLVSAAQRAAERVYPVVLRGAMRASLLVLLLAAAAGWFAFEEAKGLGRELLPEVLQGELTAEIFFPAGYPLPETDRIATELGARLAAIDGVASAAVVSGADRESVSNEEDGPHVARITMRTFKEGDARAIEKRVEARVREIVAAEPAVARFNVRRPTLLAMSAPLEIEILGENLAEIAATSRAVEAALQGMPGVIDLRSSVRRGNPEVRVTLDRRRLAEYDLDLAQVANRLRIAVEGETSSTFADGNERIDIRVRADLDRMRNVEQLRDLPVNPDAERPLPLSAVADLVIADGPSEIRHIGSRRAAVLSATPAGFDLGGLTDELQARLARVPRPPALSVMVSGQKREMEQALGSLGFALALAVFLVYAVMAAQFESLLQPFLILFSVPLAAVGAILALSYTNTPISVVALLGAVVLAGIVVNNAIVLVDRINRNRAGGMAVEAAIVEAARARLRPILMTTLTTVLGMLPLTGWLAGLPVVGGIGSAEGTELRAPMALVVIAGLSASTLLTLIVIPVGYRMIAAVSKAPQVVDV